MNVKWHIFKAYLFVFLFKLTVICNNRHEMLLFQIYLYITYTRSSRVRWSHKTLMSKYFNFKSLNRLLCTIYCSRRVHTAQVWIHPQKNQIITVTIRLKGRHRHVADSLRHSENPRLFEDCLFFPFKYINRTEPYRKAWCNRGFSFCLSSEIAPSIVSIRAGII